MKSLLGRSSTRRGTQVAVLLPRPLRGAVVRLRDLGQEVQAVRLVRRRTGLGLVPALSAVQAAREQLAEKDE